FLLILLLVQVIITYVPLVWLGGESPREVAQENIRNIKAGQIQEFKKYLAPEALQDLEKLCSKYQKLAKQIKKAKKIKNKTKREEKLEELSDSITPEYTKMKENGEIKSCNADIVLKTLFATKEDPDAILGEFEDAQVKSETKDEEGATVEFSNGKRWQFIDKDGHWKIKRLREEDLLEE
ncbi:MAG: hypothetical protein D6767_09550, partial [Candidatus Hydrogenedentota bacterium]